MPRKSTQHAEVLKAVPEHVYIMKYADRPNHLKIGRTGNLDQRLMTYSTGSHIKPEFVYSRQCENASVIEKASHKTLEAYRCAKSEWFEVSRNIAEATVERIIDNQNAFNWILRGTETGMLSYKQGLWAYINIENRMSVTYDKDIRQLSHMRTRYLSAQLRNVAPILIWIFGGAPYMEVIRKIDEICALKKIHIDDRIDHAPHATYREFYSETVWELRDADSYIDKMSALLGNRGFPVRQGGNLDMTGFARAVFIHLKNKRPPADTDLQNIESKVSIFCKDDNCFYDMTEYYRALIPTASREQHENP